MGNLYVVATPIGNLQDMSPRAIQVLKSVNLIAAEDTRRTVKLLNYFNIKCRMISYHKFNEKGRTQGIINSIIQEDIDVALVSDAGTPCISDPGYELVRSSRENGVNVIGICGPSAVVTALSISGFNTETFSFYGFLPKEKSKRYDMLKVICNSQISTFVLYESPKRIKKLMNEVKDVIPYAEVCLCCDLSKMYEKTFNGRIDDVIELLNNDENAELGEYTVVIQKENDASVNYVNGTKIVDAVNVNELSLEALLIDKIVKEGCSLKTALEMMHSKLHNVRKKEIYKASLNLKSIARMLVED